MRRLVLSIALAMSLSALTASAALAEAPEGAQKAPLFGPKAVSFNCEEGAVPTPKTFGFAVLDTPGNEMTVSGEVALKRGAPHATYNVFLEQSSGPAFFTPECVSVMVGTLTTNKKGNGNDHFTVARVPAARKFWVVVQRNHLLPTEETYASSAVELD